MKTEKEMKTEMRKHFWIGVGEALLPMVSGGIMGFAIAKILILANLI